jgi:spermidine synthase
VTGDGRLSLARDTSARYDVLIIDAFGGDAPPVHLLTREALQLYFNRLTPGGVVAFNVSNKYVNLTSVLANSGADLGMATYQRVDLEGTPSSIAAGIFPSAWIVMARSPSDLAALVSRPGWVPAQTDASHPVWTDDFSNVLSVTVFR